MSEPIQGNPIRDWMRMKNMPGWDFYDTQPLKPPANVWERLHRLVINEATFSILLATLMVFVAIDAGFGTDELQSATVVGMAYTAPYTRRESVLHGKIHRMEDVNYGPYWHVRVRAEAHVIGQEEVISVTPEVFNTLKEGGPATVVWRKGWITGWDYHKHWLQAAAKPEKE